MSWSPRVKTLMRSLLLAGAITIILLVVLFPVFWMVLTSFKTRLQTFENPPLFIFPPTLEAYSSVLNLAAALGSSAVAEVTSWGGLVYPYVINSGIVGIGNVFLSLALGVPAAYALSRLNVRGKDNIAFWMLSLRFAPGIAIAIPLFLFFRILHLFNTYQGLILAYTSFNVPFVVWIVRSFLQDMPVDLEESAMVDGYTRFGAFTRVTLPLLKPALAVAGIFSLIFSWNEFLFALVLTSDKTATFPVYISRFYSGMAINWGAFMASAAVGIIPVLVLTLLMQRYITKGLTMGAIKG